MKATRKITGLREIEQLYNNFFFDLDGVLWQGHREIEGSLQAMQYLRSSGKKMFFVTNSSVRDRPELAKRFQKFGLEVRLDECFPSSYISGLYIREKYPQIANLMVFGSSYLVNQLKLLGFNVNHVVSLPEVTAPIEISEKHMDPNCEAVLVGWDSSMTFAKSCLVSFQIQQGAKFFGTNPDKFTMIGDYKVPGAGSIISSIECATQIQAEISGKPNPYIIEKIIAEHKLERSQCIMIGDNLETDIKFGNAANISTLCVLSGVTREHEWNNKEQAMQPEYYCECLRL